MATFGDYGDKMVMLFMVVMVVVVVVVVAVAVAVAVVVVVVVVVVVLVVVVAVVVLVALVVAVVVLVVLVAVVAAVAHDKTMVMISITPMHTPPSRGGQMDKPSCAAVSSCCMYTNRSGLPCQILTAQFYIVVGRPLRTGLRREHALFGSGFCVLKCSASMQPRIGSSLTKAGGGFRMLTNAR